MPTGSSVAPTRRSRARVRAPEPEPGLLASGAGRARGLTRTLEVVSGIPNGSLHVSVQAAACDGDPETGEAPDHAACHLFQQDWGIPVVVDPAGDARITLELRAV
ncbi:hypothetical protein [Intrasporangium sp.]|uniref:hypothetical protein n=1 Tax=Intrasporangium sp. TaxID=1925024 RepID=UPI0034640DAF